MGKRFLLLVLIASFPLALYSSNPCDLNDLKILRAGIVNAQAIHTHIEIYGRYLAVAAYFEYGAPGSGSCEIMQVDANTNTSTQASHQDQIEKFKALNLINPVCDSSAGPIGNYAKFTYSSGAIVRRVDLYDQASGFLVESAQFDSDGNIMVFDRYTNLSVNMPNPLTAYGCRWTRSRRSGLIVEHENSAPTDQISELEAYSDMETAYNLKAGFSQDLASNHASLQQINTPPPSPTITFTMTVPPVQAQSSLPTSSVTSRPNLVPTSMPTVVPTLTAITVPVVVATETPSPNPTAVFIPLPTAVSTQVPVAQSPIPTPIPTSSAPGRRNGGRG